jgi:hypothetical protein
LAVVVVAVRVVDAPAIDATPLLVGEPPPHPTNTNAATSAPETARSSGGRWRVTESSV